MFRDILSAEDTAGLRIEQVQRDGRLFVRLRGLAFHSSLVVKSTESFVSESVLNVWVELTPNLDEAWSRAPEHDGGHSFDCEVEVPTGITEIRFGKAGDVVWRRATAA